MFSVFFSENQRGSLSLGKTIKQNHITGRRELTIRLHHTRLHISLLANDDLLHA
jgi:hypothetical protein